MARSVPDEPLGVDGAAACNANVCEPYAAQQRRVPRSVARKRRERRNQRPRGHVNTPEERRTRLKDERKNRCQIEWPRKETAGGHGERSAARGSHGRDSAVKRGSVIRFPVPDAAVGYDTNVNLR